VLLALSKAVAQAPSVIDFTKPHNWLGLIVVIFVVGFAAHQLANRVNAAKGVVTASWGQG
jgi:hypothetical protein